MKEMFKGIKNNGEKCENNSKKVSPTNSNTKRKNNLLEVIIGSSNVKRWNKLKTSFRCTTNEEFATKLLDLAQKQYHSNENILEKKTDDFQKSSLVENNKNSLTIRVGEDKESSNKENNDNKSNCNSFENVDELETPILTEFNNIFCELTKSENKEDQEKDFLKDCKSNSNNFEENLLVNGNHEKVKPSDKVSGKNNSVDRGKIKRKTKKKKLADIRRIPDLQKQIDEITKSDVSKIKIKKKKIKPCSTCETSHSKSMCPLHKPLKIVYDSVSKDEWSLKNSQLENLQKYNTANSSLSKEEIESTFAYVSLPKVLCYMDTDTPHGLGIFSKTEIGKYTQFGPLIAKLVKEVDIPDDFQMKELWMIFSKDSYTYWRTDDLNETNWFRFLRPSPTKEQRNVSAISKNGHLFLVSVKDIMPGDEILFWQDDNLNLKKKLLSKTNCGGCNLNFSHSIYYRTHCTIFHDIRYSLTIRKFHCKICGIAVLGKENIINHATTLHEGKGAYQCQFCKKFFLRLNYLEMHRTYGCSANPHRTWPLCDFCGKKFCQPQKLKMHIKRMHNDLTEVLKEFQCKVCLKVLGSRGGLQRHLKEVHNKQMEVSTACYQCGKLLQNKSNLKIHMLTHSGVKPFRCKEGSCNGAFTTKQCLQYHYKKAHGLSEDCMPKIERSIDYTFEAYSGVENKETDQQDRSDDLFDCDENQESMNDQNGDDPDNLEPLPSTETVSQLSQTPPHIPPPPVQQTPQPEPIFTMKILSKGSKKWLGEQLDPINSSNIDNNGFNLNENKSSYQSFDVSKTTSLFGRHESSNASLLVEAALGSVADINCNDSNIDIDVSGTPNSTDDLVGNMCTLPHPDDLPDVPYNSSVDLSTEHRNMGLISPVNENISVTDDLNPSDLQNDENIGIDYSSFQDGDFSSNNSPDNQEYDYGNANRMNDSSIPEENYDTDQSKNLSPGSSPPRYNFGGNEVTICHVSPGSPCEIAAQNLSVHDSKEELDLSIYKSSYGLDSSSCLPLRKDLKMKFSLEPDQKQLYVFEVEEISRNLNKNIFNEGNKYNILFPGEPSQVNVQDDREQDDKIANNRTSDDKYSSDLDLSFRSKYSDSDIEARSKQLEFDLNFRQKSYDLANDLLQIRSGYDNLDLDYRNKNYVGVENCDIRSKTYENTESEIRTADRNFDALVFAPTDMQGIDMTARSFHNYHTSAPAANINSRYHHLYSEVERASIDLRVNYSPPPPTYSHSDVLRVVSLDLTSPGRHTVDLSFRSNPLHAHQLPNTRLISEHNLSSRLLTGDLPSTRLLSVTETNNRVLSDHSATRLLANDQGDAAHFSGTESNRILPDDPRYINEPTSRLIEPARLLPDVRLLPTVASGTLSPIPSYPSYPVSPTAYHPPVLATRPHVTSPTPTPYHHYPSYY